MSLANDFAVEIYNRISQITVANGYQTDIGLRVFRGRRRLSPDMFPCAVLVERPDEPQKSSGGKVKVVQKYILEGHATCDADNPNDTGHQIIADLKKAVFKDGPRISDRVAAAGQRAVDVQYTGRSIAPREDGLDFVAASVEIALEFVEDLANP